MAMPISTGPTQRGLLVLEDVPTPWLHALLRDHLTGTERLALFHVSRRIATLLLQHAARVQVHLTGSGKRTAWQQYKQRCYIEKHLAAAPVAEVAVHITGAALHLWTGEIRQHIREKLRFLHLDDVCITADTLQDILQLQRCPHLHTLVLANGCMVGLPQHPELQRTDVLPPTLTCLKVAVCWPVVVEHLVRLAAPQLQYLHCECMSDPKAFGSHTETRWLKHWPLPILTQLTHINLSHLDDLAMIYVMDISSLTHVSTTHLGISKDYTKHQLSWQQLEVLSQASLACLQCLPLRHIQKLIIHSGVAYAELDPHKVQQATAHLATAPNLQCVPKQVLVDGLPAYFEFAAVLACCSSELTCLCIKSMIALDGPGLGLCLGWFEICTSLHLPLAINCIQQLPCNLDILRLRFNSGPGSTGKLTDEQWVQVLQQVVDVLPQHVIQLIVWFHGQLYADGGEQPGDACTYTTILLNRLQDSQKSTSCLQHSAQIRTFQLAYRPWPQLTHNT